jgi:hypothetical protein
MALNLTSEPSARPSFPTLPIACNLFLIYHFDLRHTFKMGILPSQTASSDYLIILSHTPNQPKESQLGRPVFYIYYLSRYLGAVECLSSSRHIQRRTNASYYILVPGGLRGPRASSSWYNTELRRPADPNSFRHQLFHWVFGCIVLFHVNPYLYLCRNYKDAGLG